MTDDPKDPASSACLAHEADDTYMGFASREEVATFLTGLTTASADEIKKMLPRVRDDALHAKLKAKLTEIEPNESKA